MTKPSHLQNADTVIRAEHRDQHGAWQEVFLFDDCIDARFAIRNADGLYRCEIETNGNRRIEHFRILNHQLSKA